MPTGSGPEAPGSEPVGPPAGCRSAIARQLEAAFGPVQGQGFEQGPAVAEESQHGLLHLRVSLNKAWICGFVQVILNSLNGLGVRPA